MIRAAKMPLLLLGAGANRKHARSALSKFVNDTQIPFFNTQMGKGVVDERSDLFLGTAALSDGDYLHCAIDRADLIINVGHDVVEKPPFFMEEGGTKVIHVNYKAAQVDQVYFPQVEVVGDLAQSIARLGDILGGQIEFDRSYSSGSSKRRTCIPLNGQMIRGFPSSRSASWRTRAKSWVTAISSPWTMASIKSGTREIIRPINPIRFYWTMHWPRWGAGLPSAMMAAKLYPDRRVMAICGDGGFMMNSQEIETAVRLGLNLVVTVLNDSSYGMIRWKQSHAGLPIGGWNSTTRFRPVCQQLWRDRAPG